ncbi:MAG: DUF3108 domain-containing protein [Bryobacteraceae bacterium]|nr:DUF3108 domain-containing protein [Bryobacteraceae bacterium]MDW8377033.1 DUF3108 domain-containing protein [Bryobacterales bacterium]
MVRIGRSGPGLAAILAAVVALFPSRGQSPAPAAASTGGAGRAVAEKPIESLQYSVEWRLIRAGTAILTRTPKPDAGWQADLHLESAGLVNKLYRVNDNYQSRFDSGYCASNVTMQAQEGSRRRDTQVRFDREKGKSHYLERDLVKNSVVLEKELDIPPCVHDVLAALAHLRGARLKPGQSTQLPITDGKRMVMAKVEAQEKERVKTSAGTFDAVRYEAFLFNDVLYTRKGRLFVWLTDDEKSLPVQIRVRLSFPTGTISFQLEKAS